MDWFSKVAKTFCLPRSGQPSSCWNMSSSSMSFPRTLPPTRVPDSSQNSGEPFSILLGVLLASHPDTTLKLMGKPKGLGCFLQCFAASQPSLWLKFLFWVKLSQNLHVSFPTGFSQKKKVEVPIGQLFVCPRYLAWITVTAPISRSTVDTSNNITPDTLEGLLCNLLIESCLLPYL